MMIKLTIIGAILLGGGIIFSNQINQFFAESSLDILDSVKNDFEKITDETIQTVETSFDGVVETVSGEVKDFQDSSTDILSENFKEISESTQEVIFFGKTEDDQHENEESIERHGSGSGSTTGSDSTIGNSGSIIITPSSLDTPQTVSFETLSLSTTQQSDDSVILHYEDTSGKTTSVTVTLRTIERELFSGVFYSSMFEAFVNDAPNTSYFIDMVIEHEELGIITSSVFNPVETPETIINGVFSQS